MRSLIIGKGEVGSSLYKVLESAFPRVYVGDVFPVNMADKHQDTYLTDNKFDILHICFGYSEEFVSEVERYQKLYNHPRYTIIHSTVPVGVSHKLNAIHSPIRGIHPNLENGIRTFPKFLGGEKASEVADYFRRAGMKVILFDKSETTEALKLFDTEYYKTCIKFAQRVKLFCDKNNLNFSEVYTIPNQTYNEGYTKLGMPEVVRPVLQPIMKPIGGHCLVPNSKLIKLNE